MQLKQNVIAALVLVATACEGDGITGPGEGDGVHFQLDGQAQAMAGSPASEAGQILGASFAVARADSVGGFALIGYQRTGENEGNLFVLQAPRQVGTMTCSGTSAPCHGRYITGVRHLNTGTSTRYFHVTSGSVTVTQIGPARLRGTFRVELEADDGQPDAMLTIESGTIDVPYVADEVTDGTLQCLLSLVGVVEGECAGSAPAP